MRVGVVLVCLVGCYSPKEIGQCLLACTTTCPGDQVCGSDQLCHTQGAQECGGVIGGDAAKPPIDAPMGCFGRDAPPFMIVCRDATNFPALLPITANMTVPSIITCSFIVNQQAQGAPPICVVAAKKITFMTGSRTFVTGPNPVMFLASEEITIEAGARITASQTADMLGAAADDPHCEKTLIDGDDAPASRIGAGGGAGGSFRGRGGAGGDSGNTANNIVGGKSAATVTVPNHVRGGCVGGRGGKSNFNGTAGGHGGGAIYFMSGGPITVDGVVEASGSPGPQAAEQEGGAGGGSGGMIVFDAGSMMFGANAKIYALGAGGGSGGGEMTNTGEPGNPPNGPQQYGTGGMLGGGVGGMGGPPFMADPGRRGEDLGDGGEAGGGGGGGGGFIFMAPPQQLAQSVVDPPPINQN